MLPPILGRRGGIGQSRYMASVKPAHMVLPTYLPCCWLTKLKSPTLHGFQLLKVLKVPEKWFGPCRLMVFVNGGTEMLSGLKQTFQCQLLIFQSSLWIDLHFTHRASKFPVSTFWWCQTQSWSRQRRSDWNHGSWIVLVNSAEATHIV